GNGVGDGGVLQQDFVDFVRGDVFTAANDDVFDPASQIEIAIVVEKTLIAGAKPSLDEGLGVGFRIIFVSMKNIGTLNDDLAALAVGKVIAGFVQNADAQARSDADRAWLA